jgi:hypothetical protein
MKTPITLNNNTKNAYILFGWEGIECRPNLDPFEGTLRTYPKTGQVYTSDVHIKHHSRRGIKAYAEEVLSINNAEIYYEKTSGEDNKARGVEDRIKAIQKNYKDVRTGQDVYNTCIDLPLYGFVWAKKNESFNKNGAINTILRPTTFHEAKTISLGRNNAFANNGAAASGSSSVDSLEYGFFLSLWEINIPSLLENIKDHKVIKSEDPLNTWVSLFAGGLWKAYTDHRFPSFTQRSQFAQFLLAWNPEDESNINPIHPKDLIKNLSNPDISTTSEAIDGLKEVLPGFLKGWQYTKATEGGRIEKNSILSDIIG